MKRPSLRETLLRQSAQYSAGTFLSIFAAVVRAGVAARYLDATEIGIWLALQVFVGYATNLHCGTVFGMFRSVPIMLARNDKAGAALEERTTFTFVLSMTALTAVVCLAAGPLIAPHIAGVFLIEAVAFTGTSLFKTVYIGIFKAERRFAELSVATALAAVVALGAAAAMPRFRLHALLIGITAQNVFEFGILLARRELPKLGISWSVLREQLRVGVLTLLSNLGVTAIFTLERTVMLQVLGVTPTGMFVLGAQLGHLVPMLAAVPAGVLTPVLFERVGRGEPLLPLAEKPIMILANIFSWVICAAFVAITPVVAHVWPQLEGGNAAAKAVLLGTFPILLAGPVTNVYYAVNKQVPLVAVLAVTSVMTYVGALVGVYATNTIAGAAIGALVGRLGYYVGSAVWAFRAVGAPVSDALALVMRSLLPMVYGLMVVAAWETAIGRVLPAASLVRAVLAQMAILLAMLPWLRRALSLLRGRA